VQFIRVQPSREREWKGWLFRVAQREAWRLTAVRRSEIGIVADDELNVGTMLEPADPRDRGEERLEFQAALQEVRKLPRQMHAVVLWRSQLATQADCSRSSLSMAERYTGSRFRAGALMARSA
jgi:DNA-directed RNA polymerase specialized sigma24 family protein